MDEEMIFEKEISLDDFKQSESILQELKDLKANTGKEFSNFKTSIEDGILRYTGERKKSGRIKGFGNNLKYFCTSFVSNRANKDQVRIDITHKCTEMLCLREGIFRLLKEGTDWKIFEKKDRFLSVYYNFVSGTLAELRDEMNALKGEKVLYCFSVDPQGLVKEDFADWNDVRLEPIPQKILDIYKQLFDND